MGAGVREDGSRRGGRDAPPAVVVVGCGAWGRNLVRCFAELGALAGVVDHHPETGALAARHGTRLRGFEAVLADPAVAGIVIATQPSSHAALALAAIDAGKHVLVEKPLALDRATAGRVAARAAAARRVLMTGHILRFHPAFEALERLVAAGTLGRLLRLHASRLGLGAIRAEEDALWCLAPHDVSMILALTGRPPATVAAMAERPLNAGIADAASLTLGFPGGATAHVTVSWLNPFKEQRLVVVGTGAMAVLDDTRPWPEKLTLWRHRIGPDRSIARGGAEPVAVEPAEPLLAECRHFLDCIATGRAPRTGPHEALAVMDVLDRAARAMAAPQPEMVS